MTLTFNLETWFMFVTHQLIMIIICAKLFSNPIMHNKVMGRTRTGLSEVYAQSLSADCDLDRSPSDMILVRDTLSCHHLCQIIFESHLVRLNYGLDTVLKHTHTHCSETHTHTHTHTQSLTYTQRQVRLYLPFRHIMAGA